MMYRVDSDNDELIPLRELTLEPASLADRPELADIVLGSPDEILGELRREVFVIGKNLPLGNDSGRRLDMLGIDREGNSVLVALDRGDEKSQLASAIMLAGLVATWKADDFGKLLSPPRAEALKEHLRVGQQPWLRGSRLSADSRVSRWRFWRASFGRLIDSYSTGQIASITSSPGSASIWGCAAAVTFRWRHWRR